MPLVLSVRNSSAIPLEVDTVQLDTVRLQSADEVRRTLIHRGNKQVELGEFFDVSGTADDGEMIWQGDCSRVKMIGSHLTSGRVKVEGDAGMHLGAEMTGGEVICTGNVADWVGAEMAGGRLVVHGNAGHLVGAAYRGGRRGMTGGELFIHGRAGNEVGHTMRRGLIAVCGGVGDVAGVGMIAGTILIGGEVGIRHGAGMNRGTIVFLGNDSPEMIPTFRDAGAYEPTWLRVYAIELGKAGLPLPDGWGTAAYRRYCGDLVELGRGEILCRES